MSNVNNPEQHINEEQRNDLIDVGMGFLVFTGVLFVIGIAATAITIAIR